MYSEIPMYDFDQTIFRSPDKLIFGLPNIQKTAVFLNTSNPDKIKEFKSFGLKVDGITRKDLKEPNADPLTVIRYKASQVGENVLVEDTSLFVDGHDVGTNIKWLMNKLNEMIGAKAEFKVYLGILLQGKIQVYIGSVKGMIVPPKGEGFGFDPVFLPNGSSKTFGEEKPRKVNARYLAVQKYKQGNPNYILEPLNSWDGDYQG